MQVSPARKVAFDILLRVENEDAYASELLHSNIAAQLSSADHGLTTEIVMGVLRWRSLLDAKIARHSSLSLQKLDAEVLTSLRVAAYQLLFLDRVPPGAVVHESVELVKKAHKRSAVPFTNAVLRKLANNPPDGRKVNAADQDKGNPALLAAELAEKHAHPLWLVERWTKTFGLATTQKICHYNQSVPETCIRFSDESIEDELKQNNILLAPGRLLNSARDVKSGDITATPAFREGRIAIQDEGSQLVAHLVGRGTSILDCCAAPGGKTRLLADRNPKAIVVAAELHPHRARLLRRLVTSQNVRVISADVRQLPINRAFERVLADVPCSGTGTLARHPEIKWRLKKEDLHEHQMRQAAILNAAMRHVGPGGRVLYATCSLEPEENADVVSAALAENSEFRNVDVRTELERLRLDGELAWKDLDSLVSGPYLRTIQGVHPCDGFFAVILQRNL
ncbi:MAG: 16S rRNA (cytosine(967)-C(5))-methyltransferase RsmB [Terriglobales bacterium]